MSAVGRNEKRDARRKSVSQAVTLSIASPAVILVHESICMIARHERLAHPADAAGRNLDYGGPAPIANLAGLGHARVDGARYDVISLVGRRVTLVTSHSVG
jgi:hypothetical protein